MTPPTRDLYRDLFERSADAHLVIENGRVIDCNAAAVAMLRYADKRQVLGLHPARLSPQRQPDGQPSHAKAEEMMAIALEQGSHRFEWDHKRADGEVFPVEVALTALPGEMGPRLHTVWRDITERRRLEADLRQAQKMEAVGKLAGGVAHDFNNLLVAILGHSELLEMALSTDSELLANASEIRRAGERAADLVGQLLAFSRKQVLRPRVVDVGPLVDDLARMLQRVIGERIDLITYTPDAPLCVTVDPNRLEQVVLNLATNARDAMPEGGTLTLAVRGRALAASDEGRRRLPPGRYAELSVTDTGDGIAPELLDRVFDPFFTTKEQGAGTGLGLATVYGIVKQSGGDIEVESTPGAGTVFRIHLPLVACEKTAAAAAPTQNDAQVGSETVLLVEDDASAASLMARVLTSAGYRVLAAEDGVAALELVARHGLERVDMLLTDVVMPRLGGLELASRLREQRPDLPVLFASGYSEATVMGDRPVNGDFDLLQKPFSPRELRTRVRGALDRDANGTSS
jgi:PAS domain S-box-containing protein